MMYTGTKINGDVIENSLCLKPFETYYLLFHFCKYHSMDITSLLMCIGLHICCIEKCLLLLQNENVLLKLLVFDFYA